MMLRALVLTVSLGLLAGCNVLPERVPVDLYQLPPSSLTSGAGSALEGGLRLARPATSDALGGNRVLILTEDHSFQAFPEARWAAPIPQLWRDWLLDAFWRDGRVSELSTSGDSLVARLELTGMLRAMHVERINGQMHGVVRYDAQLVDVRTRSIIASRRFEASQRISSNDVTEAVRALGTASDQLAAELIAWTVAQSNDG